MDRSYWRDLSPCIGDKGSQTHDEEGNQRVALAFVWLYRELSVLDCARSLWGSPSRIITTRDLCNLVPDSLCLFHTLRSMELETGRWCRKCIAFKCTFFCLAFVKRKSPIHT